MNVARSTSVGARPLLRGWSHALALIASVPVTIALGVQSRDDAPRLISMLAYGLSMVGLYAISSVYHLGKWRGPRRQVVRALDHASIFVVIAGTYTPVCVNVLSGWMRPAVLLAIWSLAAVGVGCSVLTLSLPRWVTAGLYLAMGWVAVVPAPSLIRLLPLTAIACFLLGGLLYTVGAVVYSRRRPDPLPRVFGFHEVFHLLVIAGSMAFLASIWIWVIPFPRA